MSQTKQICVATVLTALLSFTVGAVQSAPDGIDQQKRDAAAQAATHASSSPGRAIVDPSARRASALTGIEVDAAPALIEIVMDLTGAPAYDAYVTEDGKYLNVDLYDTIALDDLKMVIVDSGNTLSDLHVSVVSVHPQFVTRVAVPLSSASHFSLSDESDHLYVVLAPSAVGADPALAHSESLSRQWERQWRSPRIAEAYLIEAEKRFSPGLEEEYNACAESIGSASDLLRSVKKDLLSLQLAGVSLDTAAASKANEERFSADLAIHEPVIRKAMRTLRALDSDYKASGRQIRRDLALYRESIAKRQDAQRVAMAAIFEADTGRIEALEALSAKEYAATTGDQEYLDSLLRTRDKNAAMLSARIRSLAETLATSRHAIEGMQRQSVEHAVAANPLDRFDAALASRGGRSTGATGTVANRLDALTSAMTQVAERKTTLETEPLMPVAALTGTTTETFNPAPPGARNALTRPRTQREAMPTTAHRTNVRTLRASPEDMALAQRDGILVMAQNQQDERSGVSDSQQIRMPSGLSRKPSANLINAQLSAAEDPLRQTVDVNFKNMPLDNVVSLLANKGQIQVISAVDLAGGVTANLKDISLGRAIEVILRNENLGIVEEDGIYRIMAYEDAVAARRDTRMITLKNANALEVKTTLLEVISSSPEAGFISISANATTNMLIIQGPRSEIRDLEDLVARLDVADAVLPTQTKIIPLNYADPASVMTLLTTGGMTSATGKVSVDMRTRQLIVTDLPQNIEAILELIPILDQPVKQVSIEVMIVDAIMTDDAQSGFQWFMDAVQKGTPPMVGGHLASFGAGFEDTITSAGSLAFSVLSGDIDLTGIIRAEVLSNNAELLAQPILVTTENNPAIINLTTEFPYQETIATGAGPPIAATQFKEIGTVLSVTPQVTHDNHIGIQIDVKQSAVTGFTTTEVPIEAKRSIQTNLRLNDGESIFIGGLRSYDDRLRVKKVPILGDIPFLNFLFRSNSVTQENIELLIFLTCNVLPDDPPSLTPHQKMKYDILGGTPELPNGTRAVLRPYLHPEEQRDPIWKWKRAD